MTNKQEVALIEAVKTLMEIFVSYGNTKPKEIQLNLLSAFLSGVKVLRRMKNDVMFEEI